MCQGRASSVHNTDNRPPATGRVALSLAINNETRIEIAAGFPQPSFCSKFPRAGLLHHPRLTMWPGATMWGLKVKRERAWLPAYGLSPPSKELQGGPRGPQSTGQKERGPRTTPSSRRAGDLKEQMR